MSERFHEWELGRDSIVRCVHCRHTLEKRGMRYPALSHCPALSELAGYRVDRTQAAIDDILAGAAVPA